MLFSNIYTAQTSCTRPLCLSRLNRKVVSFYPFINVSNKATFAINFRFKHLSSTFRYSRGHHCYVCPFFFLINFIRQCGEVGVLSYPCFHCFLFFFVLLASFPTVLQTLTVAFHCPLRKLYTLPLFEFFRTYLPVYKVD